MLESIREKTGLGDPNEVGQFVVFLFFCFVLFIFCFVVFFFLGGGGGGWFCWVVVVVFFNGATTVDVLTASNNNVEPYILSYLFREQRNSITITRIYKLYQFPALKYPVILIFFSASILRRV